TEAVLYGGTGQAKVVRPILENQGVKVIAVFDDTPDLDQPFPDVELCSGRPAIDAWLDSNKSRLASIGFSITIGNPHGEVRCRLHDQLAAAGLVPLQVIHPSAVIAHNAVIGAGCQIMAGAVVGAEASLGRQCIINTLASVDHECVLEEGVELAPGAILCGLVSVGKYGWICAGATVLPRVSIGTAAIVGAGSLVRQDVAARDTVIGVPAHKLTRE
ncbi:MAG: NeuD/PglB/VioB family sugar acetyltransferase, partial [Gammaproteobacteria bacterium]